MLRSTLTLIILGLLVFTGLPGSMAQLPELPIDTGTTVDGGVAVGPGGAKVETDIDQKINVTVPALGSSASFEFKMPLAQGPRFAFRDGMEVYDSITITVHWQDATGNAKPFPATNGPAAVLELKSQSSSLRPPIMSLSDDRASATFQVSSEQLARGAVTEWTISASAPGEATKVAGSSASISHYYTQRGEIARVAIYDADLDKIPDDVDNCRTKSNPDQANLDGDRYGDACDDDIDDDGASNIDEAAAGSDPRNRDSTPDDPDADGFSNDEESAAGSNPRNPLSTPNDPDADGYTTAQEQNAGSDPRDARSTPHDVDGDGFQNEADLCPRHADDQKDSDGDGIGDACDANNTDGPLGDSDGDGIQNSADNCPSIANPDQKNQDGDLRGDLCDYDRDGDTYPNSVDTFPDDVGEWSDFDGDGIGDNADQDDDNDGLTDIAEVALGTNPQAADSDGDLLDDLTESTSGTDPLNKFDPPYHPTDVRLIPTDAGVQIQWTGTSDARVSHYIVWQRSPMIKLAVFEAAGPLSHVYLDAAHHDDDVMYSVQAILQGQLDKFDQRQSGHGLITKDQVAKLAADPSQPDGPADGPEKGDPELVDPTSKDAVALPIIVIIAGLLIAARRRLE